MISTWRSLISTFLNKPNVLFVILGLSLAPAPAGAFDFLHFKTAENNREKRVILFIKNKSQNTDIEYKIAQIDLNNDLLNEYIVKPTSCPKGLCTHHVVAFMEGQPIELLTVNARKIAIEETHRYGVRDLTVYASEMNDFQKTRYYWNPHSFSYKQNLGVKSR